MKLPVHYLLLLLFLLALIQCGVMAQEEPIIHPHFEFTQSTIGEVIATLPSAASQEIAHQYSYLFLDLLSEVVYLADSLLVLVDKNHPLSPQYVPSDLVTLDTYAELVLNVAGMKASQVIIPDLLAMVNEAYNDGHILDISSAYRDYTYQASLYQRNVDLLGSKSASRVSAQAGHSQHQLGTVVDFGSVSAEFDNTPASLWLQENAWRFGFSLSYPVGGEEITGYQHESWHWRYVGRSASLFERYFFDGIQQYMLEFIHTHREYIKSMMAPEISASVLEVGTT